MSDFILLCFTVVSISAIHTFSGPDHYLPFIVFSRSRKWTLNKTIFWTSLCGFGHVLSSVILGGVGLFLGWSITQTFGIEEIRGDYAAYLLLLFGVLYILYALYNLSKNKTHKHFDSDENGEIYVFEHQHGNSYIPKNKFKVTPWVLFFIFVLGPSEPMIPLIIYPSVHYSFYEVSILIGVYTFATVFTMLSMVLFGYFGINGINFSKYEKYIDVFSGVGVVLCSLGMIYLEM